jgi:spoIIIJ-associated protein
MEWVETTGRTLEEAKEAALDELGVAAEDAEFDVVEEPRSGLFGRVRQEARVRARVRPTSPRPKADRRDRRRKPAEGGAAAQEPSPARAEAPAATPSPGRARGGSRAPSAPVAVEDVADELAADVVGEGAAVVQAVGANPGRSPQRGGGRGRGTAPRDEVAANGAAARGRGADVDDEPSLDEQRETVVQFLDGLVDAFGATATVEVEEVDDETLEARSSVTTSGCSSARRAPRSRRSRRSPARSCSGQPSRVAGARLRVDIGGYREHRREALGRFTRRSPSRCSTAAAPWRSSR